ncbi:MAG: hypothetical protein ABIL09_12515 [Gemmatimonadota bacterium]
MTAVSGPGERKAGSSGLPRPTVFDLAAFYEPSAHFRFTRRVRDDFDALAKDYTRSTWLLGRYGGRPNMQTDIQGIGVASRIEIGRVSLREDSQEQLVRNAFEFFRACQEQQLASGQIDRITVFFSKADDRPRERAVLQSAFGAVFGGECRFLCRDRDMLELGRCIAYQSLTQYLREDGLYHSSYRGRIEVLQRHLHQEVGRYENHKFYVRPEPVPGSIPHLDFCYTGALPDRRVEAFVEGYTDEQVKYVTPETFRGERERYVALEDYERASRRFGGLWILQDDIVRHLMAQQVGVLYLFFGDDMMPALERTFSWPELFGRQRQSNHINRAMRNSQTFLEMVLEGLVRGRFITDEDDGYRLTPGFPEFQHVSFYNFGEFRKRGQ